MSYAIISLGGKQYRVREGQRLLVDRLGAGDGDTLEPRVLLVGGDGEPRLAPGDVAVTVRVLGRERGPKLRIGKYKKRTGYKRHAGFRAALTRIEVESIGLAGKAGRAETPAKAEKVTKAETPPKTGKAKAAEQGSSEGEAAQTAPRARKPATPRRKAGSDEQEGTS